MTEIETTSLDDIARFRQALDADGVDYSVEEHYTLRIKENGTDSDSDGTWYATGERSGTKVRDLLRQVASHDLKWVTHEDVEYSGGDGTGSLLSSLYQGGTHARRPTDRDNAQYEYAVKNEALHRELLAEAADRGDSDE